MAARRYELDTRILTVFFFVAMPFVAFGSLVVVGMAESALRERIARDLEQRASEAKFYVERYVADQILHLRLVGTEAEVLSQLSQPTAEPNAGDARRRELAGQSPLSQRLRDVIRLRAALNLLQAVDTEGRLVATSGRGGRALHAEAPWFQALLRDPLPAPWVSDVVQHTETSLAVLEVAFPVYDATGEWLGALFALVDATELYGVLAPVRVGRTGHAILIRGDDGVVLASDDQQMLTQPFTGFAAVQAAKREHRGYWMVTDTRRTGTGAEVMGKPASIIGFSAVDQVPNVDWIVVVEQSLDEAHAPVSGVTRYLWLHFIGAFGTIILLALYFSFKLEAPVIDEQLHLHEQHIPASMRSSVSED